MEILGVGPLELIVILLIAMVIFGPDRLPEMGAKLGKGMRSLRRATREFSREIETTRQAVQAPFQEVTQPLQEVRDSMREVAPLAAAVANPQAALRQAVLRELKGPEDAAESDAPAYPQILADAEREPAENAQSLDAPGNGEVETEVPAGQNGAPASPAPSPSAEQEASPRQAGDLLALPGQTSHPQAGRPDADDPIATFDPGL